MSFDPRNSEQLFFLGRAYEHAGRTVDATARYSQAAAIDPSNTDVLLGLGRLALRENKVAEARRAADQVLARFPVQRRRAAAGRTRGGTAEPAAGRTARLRARARRGTENYVDVHIALGRVEAGAGRRAEARRHFERALELDPSRRAELTVWLERVAANR